MACRNCSSSCACSVTGTGGVTVTGTGAGLTPYVVNLSVVAGSGLTAGVGGLGFDKSVLAVDEGVVPWPWAGDTSNGEPLYWDSAGQRLVTSPDTFAQIPTPTATAQTPGTVTQTAGTVSTLGSAISPTFTNDSAARNMNLIVFYFVTYSATGISTTGSSFTLGMNLDTGGGPAFIAGHQVTLLSTQTRFTGSTGMAYYRANLSPSASFTPSLQAAIQWSFGAAGTLSITATPTIQYFGGTS